jgi:hypothetical protein
MDPITVVILIATLVADLTIGAAAWTLARRQGKTQDTLAEAVGVLKQIAENHDKRLVALEQKAG